MNKIVLFLFFVVINLTHAQNDIVKAGEDIIYHQVEAGETVAMLYKRYLVPPEKIYELNEGATEGINAGMILKIPISEAYRNKLLSKGSDLSSQVNSIENDTTIEEVSNNSTEITDNDKLSYVKYSVKQDETLYEIAYKNKTKVDKIKELNPGLTEVNLQVDQIIFIPINNEIEKEKIKEINESDDTNSTIDVKNKIENNSNSTSGLIEYIIVKGDTLYSLAKKHNTTIEQIQKNNPNITKKGLLIGQKIKL